MRAVCKAVGEIRPFFATGACARGLCYFREPIEVDFQRALYSEHFTQSPQLDRRLVEGAAAVEEAAEKLRVPCFLKNDPEDVSTRNCTANLALAEELGGHQPTLAALLAALKVDLIDAIDDQNLFRCVSCSTLFSGPLDELQAMQFMCPVVKKDKEEVHCDIMQSAFHDVFRKVANLWAKKLRIDQDKKSLLRGADHAA